MVIFTKDMSTGAVLTHGVSGYECLGQPGDFQEQVRGEPWEQIVNDPIRSQLNAQSHIGVMLSNFNEPWTGGVLQDINFSAQPYRTPPFGEPVVGPPGPTIESIKIVDVDYPGQIGKTFAQEMPLVPVHRETQVKPSSWQNLTFETPTFNDGTVVTLMNGGYVPLTPNQVNFQGSTVAPNVHPNADKAGQQTMPNTATAGTGSDNKNPPPPYQKLPNGVSVGDLQPGEGPQLWQMGAPPQPQVQMQEGPAHLAATAPPWW